MLGTSTITSVATRRFLDCDFFFNSKNRIFEINVHSSLQVIASASFGSATTSEHSSKHISQIKFKSISTLLEVGEIKSTKILLCPAVAVGVVGSVRSKLIILRALLIILKHLVGLIHFFELGFVSTSFVWM